MRKDLLFVGIPFGNMEKPLLYVGQYVFNPTQKTLYIENGGEWFKVLKVYVESSSIWNECAVYCGDDGDWK